MLSFRFNKIQARADLIWKFQRFEFIEEYMDSYAFQPPLNLIAYLIMAFDRLRKKTNFSTVNTYLEDIGPNYNFSFWENLYATQLLETEGTKKETEVKMKDVDNMKKYFEKIQNKMESNRIEMAKKQKEIQESRIGKLEKNQKEMDKKQKKNHESLMKKLEKNEKEIEEIARNQQEIQESFKSNLETMIMKMESKLNQVIEVNLDFINFNLMITNTYFFF